METSQSGWDNATASSSFHKQSESVNDIEMSNLRNGRRLSLEDRGSNMAFSRIRVSPPMTIDE